MLADSNRISIIDNFWVWSPSFNRTWTEILEKRDISKELMKVVLGVNKQETNGEKRPLNDLTSIFTVKGTFPKAIYDGKLFKKGMNADFEAIAFQLGQALGIETAEAEVLGSDGLVACKLFTSSSVSMAHADDLLDESWRKYTVSPREALYRQLQVKGHEQLLRQFERILILSYLTSNFDMLEENFGVLYDPKRFGFISIAPAFDFNGAFQDWGNPLLFPEWEMDFLAEWASRHKDITERVPFGIEDIVGSKHLNAGQKRACVDRLKFLKSLE